MNESVSSVAWAVAAPLSLFPFPEASKHGLARRFGRYLTVLRTSRWREIVVSFKLCVQKLIEKRTGNNSVRIILLFFQQRRQQGYFAIRFIPSSKTR
jgi:hypothetical protein